MKAINIVVTPAEDKSAGISLEGDLTLGNTQQVVQTLAEAIRQYHTIHMEVKNIINIDLTGIQLLLASKNTGQKYKKQFTIHLQLPDEVNTIMDHAGFKNLSTLLLTHN